MDFWTRTRTRRRIARGLIKARARAAGAAGAPLAGMSRLPGVRGLLRGAHHRLGVALAPHGADGLYGAGYFGGAHLANDGKKSGYASYDRFSSDLDIAAYVVWRFFEARRTLDIGCAVGYLVEAEAELGIDAVGVDVSAWAVSHGSPGAAGRLLRNDLADGLLFRDGSFDLVTAVETLEHLPPERIPSALAELRRVTRGHVLCTIPSFGSNPGGLAGCLEGKVRPERLAHYQGLGDSYSGPVPHEDLFRDSLGEPIEGHLTIASFAWWTEQFEAAGLVRSRDLERRITPVLQRYGLGGWWQLYVLRVPEASDPPDALRSDAAIDAAENLLRLRLRETC